MFKTGACCGERTEHSRMPIKQSILFVSRRPLQMQKIEGIGTLKPVRQIEEMEKLEGVYMESMSSKSDIDRRYEAAQLHYPAWVDWKYGKTLAGRLRRSRFSLLQHIWYSPITGKKFIVGRHPGQEIKKGTAMAILKRTGIEI